MTDIEEKVIEILTEHEPTADVWGAPIRAVECAMNWRTPHTHEFVNGLIERKLIECVQIVRDGAPYDVKARWEKGSAYPVTVPNRANVDEIS
jgi:hypothetical protein